MDVQKENKLIQEAFEIEAEEIGFCLDQKWGDYDNPYENSDTFLAYNLFKKGWQASKASVPEGFVLVPREPTEKMIEAAESEAFDPYGEDFGKIYKAMIETQEPSNEH